MTEPEQESEYDLDKIDEAVLALLHLTSFGNRDEARAWKGHDWDALGRLHEKGFIHNPVGKAKSVSFTSQGKLKAADLCQKLFGKQT